MVSSVVFFIYPLSMIKTPSSICAFILLCEFTKSMRFFIVVSSLTTIEPASEPSELYKFTVLSEEDIELEIPNSANLVLSVATTVIVSFL